MKNRIAVTAIGALMFACSPKTVVQTTAPASDDSRTDVASRNIAKGKTLYENNCGKCHRLFSPSEETADNWEPILKRMQRKAKLADPDMSLIHDYIFTNLSK